MKIPVTRTFIRLVGARAAPPARRRRAEEPQTTTVGSDLASGGQGAVRLRIRPVRRARTEGDLAERHATRV